MVIRDSPGSQTLKDLTHRGLLALDAAAVEPQSRDAVGAALDVEDTLVVPLSGLRLRQVLGQQRDRPHDSGRDVDLSGGEDLRTLLERSNQKEKEEDEMWLERSRPGLRGCSALHLHLKQTSICMYVCISRCTPVFHFQPSTRSSISLFYL